MVQEKVQLKAKKTRKKRDRAKIALSLENAFVMRF